MFHSFKYLILGGNIYITNVTVDWLLVNALPINKAPYNANHFQIYFKACH